MPVVNVTPSIQTVEVTLTTILTATVTGLGPFTYQWQRGEEILTDETRNTLVIYNVSYEDQSYYRCLITNEFGDLVISNRAWLQVARMLISSAAEEYAYNKINVVLFCRKFATFH